jgi:hypothetical protein
LATSEVSVISVDSDSDTPFMGSAIVE